LLLVLDDLTGAECEHRRSFFKGSPANDGNIDQSTAISTASRVTMLNIGPAMPQASFTARFLSLVGRPAHEVDAVDIGAGTGIWTRMLAAKGLRSVTAVEPSDENAAVWPSSFPRT